MKVGGMEGEGKRDDLKLLGGLYVGYGSLLGFGN